MRSGLTEGKAVREFKQMVRVLHSAGIEVIMDVVYNHTAEGNQLGPTLSLRGIDNSSYYRVVADNPRYYMDYTGCGNTLNMRHPRVLQLIMDSLRYWVTEMHVDGFRFDLASSLARELFEVDRLGAFFDIIHQDPVISQVKLIAEPWDLGEGGYQVGNFPVEWTEWNGRYRDAIRRFWKGDKGTIAELATRLCGSRFICRQPPAALCQHQFRDRARRFHDARSGELQPKAQRSQRRQQQRRRVEQSELELRRGRADRRRRNQSVAPAAGSQFLRHAAPLARRADDSPRRRVWSHAKRKQQRLLPRQRNQLAELAARRRAKAPAPFCLAGDSIEVATSPCFAGRSFFKAGRCAAKACKTFTGANHRARK